MYGMIRCTRPITLSPSPPSPPNDPSCSESAKRVSDCWWWFLIDATVESHTVAQVANVDNWSESNAGIDSLLQPFDLSTVSSTTKCNLVTIQLLFILLFQFCQWQSRVATIYRLFFSTSATNRGATSGVWSWLSNEYTIPLLSNTQSRQQLQYGMYIALPVERFLLYTQQCWLFAVIVFTRADCPSVRPCKHRMWGFFRDSSLRRFGRPLPRLRVFCGCWSRSQQSRSCIRQLPAAAASKYLLMNSLVYYFLALIEFPGNRHVHVLSQGRWRHTANTIITMNNFCCRSGCRNRRDGIRRQRSKFGRGLVDGRNGRRSLPCQFDHHSVPADDGIRPTETAGVALSRTIAPKVAHVDFWLRRREVRLIIESFKDVRWPMPRVRSVELQPLCIVM